MEKMMLKNLSAFSQMVVHTTPVAKADLRGNEENPGIGGTVYFYPAGAGTMVAAEVFGLPRAVRAKGEMQAAGPFYAFHIHEGRTCGSGAGEDPFPASGGHFNPGKKPHPEHVGDMPPLLSDKGYAYTSFYTGRFAPEDVVGRTVIIHQHADDFHTQPSGMSGTKLACGQIVLVPEK